MNKITQLTINFPTKGKTTASGKQEKEFYTAIGRLMVRAPMGSYEKGVLQTIYSTFIALINCNTSWKDVAFVIQSLSGFVR